MSERILEGPILKEACQGFVPSPMDTSKVALPERLRFLRDKMAEHIHDVWSVSKIDSGWIYGDVRNDHLKQHPCLKSYANLSEEEKCYDFNLAFQTLG